MKNVERCSVVMPVNRLHAHLGDAIRSISAQSWPDVELVIVLHRADTKLVSATEALCANMNSTIFVHSDAPTLPEARNIGIAAATGNYYAVLDSDDVANCDRIVRQIRFLQENPECICVGSWAQLIDANGNIIGINKPNLTVDFSTQYGLFRQAALIHSTLMCRMSDIHCIGQYSPWFRASHDQELLLRFSQQGSLKNLQTPLIQLRLHNDPERVSNRKQLFQQLATLRLLQIKRAGIIGNGPFDSDPVFEVNKAQLKSFRQHDRWFFRLLKLEHTASTHNLSFTKTLSFSLQSASLVMIGKVKWYAVLFAHLRVIRRYFMNRSNV